MIWPAFECYPCRLNNAATLQMLVNPVNSNWGSGSSAAVFYANSYHVISHVTVTGITVNVSFIRFLSMPT